LFGGNRFFYFGLVSFGAHWLTEKTKINCMSHLHNIMELVSLVIAICYYPYLKNSFMKWFLPFLAFIFLGELLTAWYHYYEPGRSNAGIYYIISIIESVFYNYILYKIQERVWLKKPIFFFAFITVTAYILGFLSDSDTYLFSVFIVSGFFMAAIAVGYLYIKFVEDDSADLIAEPGFWIAFGVSLFFSGISVVYSLHDYILENDLSFSGARLYNFVSRVLSVFLYSSISIAIILCKRKSRASSLPYLP
jgi:hypothetical protein